VTQQDCSCCNTVLKNTAAFFNSVLQYAELCCKVMQRFQHTDYTCPDDHTLQHMATHRNTLQHTATETLCVPIVTRRKTPQHIATHRNRDYVCPDSINCNTLQHTATHCNTLQAQTVRVPMLTHRNALQHTATHRNPLQHTATHCISLQHRLYVSRC